MIVKIPRPDIEVIRRNAVANSKLIQHSFPPPLPRAGPRPPMVACNRIAICDL